ncbi:MAG TPA: MBL fold metallo-hydrolase [Opitutaceae bacterium]|nr:MBL fold metallo-hydrolase [Opitutaceae bacterium]
MKWPLSDHFNGKRFYYPGDRAGRGFADVLKWKLTSQAARWPRDLPRPHVALPIPPAPPSPSIAVTWIGHSTFLVQSAAGNWLTDPFFSERAGPGGRIGPKRAVPAALAPRDLTALAGVLLSHDHYDHCDPASLRAIADRFSGKAPLLYAPLGYASLSGGLPLRELDWWESVSAAETVAVQLVPARHWCRRTLGGDNVRLWGGFVLRLPGTTLYFAGDTAFDETLFRDIARRCGPIDTAFLPIGAYEPRWFMRDAHMNPAEAVAAHRLLGARRSIAMHWGTIQLTDEAYDDPPRALAQACAEANLPEGAFQCLAIGERREIP